MKTLCVLLALCALGGCSTQPYTICANGVVYYHERDAEAYVLEHDKSGNPLPCVDSKQ